VPASRRWICHCHGFDGAGGKELDTMVTVRNETVARAVVRGYRLASLPNPSVGEVDGAKFPSGAGRPHGTNPGGAAGGCDHWPPKRSGLREAGESNVDSPVYRAVGKRRAVSEQESS